MKQKLNFVSGTAVMLCVLAIAGCKPDVQSATPPATAPVVALPPAATADEVKSLRTEVLLLKARVASLASGEITVSSVETNYAIAKTDFGPFTVSVLGMSPYLDGFTAKLRIGNLTSANFNGVKVTASWGPPLAAGFEEYLNKRKNKEVGLTTTLNAGTFTDISVALTPAKPEEVKEFDVGLKLDQLSLRVK